MSSFNIEVRGAKENNLKNVNIDIPIQQSTVFVGVSGSGKSSLVYDVIYNESQRIFFENYASNNLKLSSPANVDKINNLPAAISVSQTSYNKNPRSTIGTLTDISHFIRTLFTIILKHEKQIVIRPNDLSFNNPATYCNQCKGLGESYKIDEDILVDVEKTLENHAILWFKGAEKSFEFQKLAQYCIQNDIPLNVPFKQLSRSEQKALLYANGTDKVNVSYKTKNGRYKKKVMYFKGAITEINEYLADVNRPSSLQKIKKYLAKEKCPLCKGFRLQKSYLDYKILELNIYEIEQLNFDDLTIFMKKLYENYKNILAITQIVLRILAKVDAIRRLKLSYLNLNRSIPTLSGGELQRIRLATQLNSGLTGLLYILDEPCKGLHIKDIPSIIEISREIVSRGNTLIAIEHYRQYIESIDNLIYMGPGAGKYGGNIITAAEYSYADMDLQPYKIKSNKLLQLEEITYRNLENFSIRFPENNITAITGVSGSGKSSLLEVIENHYSNEKHEKTFKKVYKLTQAPIYSNSRSKVVSYLDVFTDIRNLFANTLDANKQKISASDFSFNVGNGRCRICEGQGEIKVEVSFLEDMFLPCEECNGTGYSQNILDITYRDKNIYEVLNTEINDLLVFFEDVPTVLKKITIIEQLGMGYIKLGQATSTLSGGEEQRLKLSKILGGVSCKNALFLLDEPTAGLSKPDMMKLRNVLNIIAKDNTIIIVEHNIPFINSTAHYLIDIGFNKNSYTAMLNAQGFAPEIYSSKKLSFN